MGASSENVRHISHSGPVWGAGTCKLLYIGTKAYEGESKRSSFVKRLTAVHPIVWGEKKSTKTRLSSEPLDVELKELQQYYMTDSISRSSQTMAKCVAAVKADKAKNKY